MMSLSTPQITQILYTPHHKTLTASGQYHFSRVSDAIAEFVDNSIQATCSNKNQSRDISVSIYLEETVFNGGFIMISDNGVGMETHELQQFATYSLDQISRGNNPNVEDGNHSFISKYGVGAKQAGFYFGDRIHIITTKSKGPHKVFEMTMDEKEYQTRSLQNQNVYSGEVIQRSPNQILQNYTDMNFPSLQLALSHHEEIHSHFTCIIVRLRNNFAYQLLKDNKCFNIPMELADIYYFHMHPEHTPNRILGEKRFQTTSRSRGGNHADDLKIQNPIRGTFDKEETPINLTMYLSIGSNIIHNNILLNNIESPIQNFIKSAHWVFRFNMTVPDPNPILLDNDNNNNTNNSNGGIGLTQETRKLQKNTTNNSNSLTGSIKYPRTIQCILFYYPSIDGHETFPSTTTTTLFHQDNNSNNNEEEAFFINNNNDDDDNNNDEANIDHPIFDIFWQCRLVPESKVKSLPFFPENITSRLQCDLHGIPENWRRRLKGFLFFDSDFTHISNNKLKIQVDPDLHSWLNTIISKDMIYKPTCVENEFKLWLTGCHKKFDQDFKFELRDKTLEKNNGKAIFKKVKVGQDTLVLQGGDIVRLFVTSSGRGGKGRERYGKILYFEVDYQYLTGDQSYCYGRGNIVYHREPIDIFSSGTSVPLSISMTALKFDGKTKVGKAEIAELIKSSVKKITILLFSESEPNGVLLKDNTLECDAGQSYTKIAVQLLNGFQKVVVGLPQEIHHKYKLKLRVITKPDVKSNGNGSNQEDVVLDGSWKELMDNDEVDDDSRLTGTSITNNTKSKKGAIDKLYYIFPNVKFSVVGSYSLRVEVLETTISRAIDLKVNSCQPTSFHAELSKTDGLWSLGSFLPDFSIQFLDDLGNNAAYVGKFRIFMKDSESKMKVVCDGLEDPFFELEASENGGLFFENDQWLALPKLTSDLSPPFLSYHQIVSKEITFIISSDICPGFSFPFTMTYGPGEPYKIEILEPVSGELSVVNGEIIPVVKLATYDRWKNRCSPNNGDSQWVIAVDHDGPLADSITMQSPILGTGEAVFSSCLRADISEIIPQEGLLAKQLFRLVKLGEEGGNNSKSGIVVELSVRVMPSKAPSVMEILRDGIPVPQPWTETVGTLITGLTFRVLSEDGEEFELSEGDLLRGRSGGIRVSWKKDSHNKAVRRNPTIENNNSIISLYVLPDIQLTTSTTEGIEENYEVTVNFARFESINIDFTIHLVPDVAETWSMLHSDDIANGILNKDSLDLIRKLRGICMLDKYGNITSTLPSGSASSSSSGSTSTTNRRTLIPILEGKWINLNNDNEEDDNNVDNENNNTKMSIELELESTLMKDNNGPMLSPSYDSPLKSGVFVIPVIASSISWDNSETVVTKKGISGKNSNKSVTLPTTKNIAVYAVAPNAFLSAQCVPSSLRLKIRDAENTLVPWSYVCMVTAGRPTQVILTSASLGITDMGKCSKVNVLPWSEVSDLMLQVVDSTGQSVTLRGIKNLTLEIIGPNDLLVWRKKNCKSDTVCASFKFSKIFDTLTKGNNSCGPLETILECRGSYITESSEAVDISCATLVLQTKPMNIVTKLALKLIVEEEEEEERSSEKAVIPTVCCDELFPSFKIGTVTDDGNSYVPPVAFLTVTVFMVPDKGTKNIHTVDPHSLFDDPKLISPITELHSQVNYSMSQDFSRDNSSYNYSYIYQSIAPLPIATGSYTFAVAYEEQRQEMTTIPPNLRKVTAECKFRVVSGKMIRLALSDSSATSIKSLVSNSSCSIEERIIASNRLKIIGYDTGNNVCTVPSDISIGCYLYRSLSASSATTTSTTTTVSSGLEMPKLVGADVVSGVLFAERCKDNQGFVFPQLQLQPDIGRGNDELIEIHFCAYQTQSSQCIAELDSIKSLVKTFRFTSDQDKSEKAAQLHAVIQPLLDMVAAHKSEVASTLTTITSLLSSLANIMRRSPTGILRPYVSDPSRLTLQDSDRLINELQSQKSDMENCISQIRPVMKRPHCPPESAIAGKAVTGQVCNLGFVDDFNTAFVMSWAAQNRIDAMVVPTSVVATQLYHDNVKVWAEDQMSKFEIRNGQEAPRYRNDEEIQRGMLPLPAITWDQQGPVPGNPKYMVNLIQLDKKYEYLRDTVFYLIFQRMLLFDTLETALQYRTIALRQRKQVPHIFTLDGHKVSADGVLDPRVGAGRKPERLDFVFGAQLPNTTDDFRILELDLQLLFEIQPLLHQVELVKLHQRELLHQQNRIKGYEEEIEELYRQLDTLGKENVYGNMISQNDNNNNNNNNNNRVVGEKNKIRPPSSGAKDLKRQRIQIGHK